MSVRKRPVALLSVSNKVGIIEFARRLIELGFTILSTGGTKRALEEAGLTVTAVESYTGFPEMMGGRVKTLHPKIHGGILADRANAEHLAQAEAHGIGMIDLVAVNLYPFRETIARPDADFAEAVENIDIGGPAMIRAAAKNHESVIVVCNPARYDEVLEQIAQPSGVSEETRRRLALEAYEHTAQYDTAIAYWFATQLDTSDGLPPIVAPWLKKQADLCYGENKSQGAATYSSSIGFDHPLAFNRFTQVAGGTRSYNNVTDLDRLSWTMSAVDELLRANYLTDHFIAIGVKHGNPCAGSIGMTEREAIEMMAAGDPLAMFGGSLMCNFPLDEDLAELLVTHGMPDGQHQKFDCVIASGVDAAAEEILARKRGKCRILVNPALGNELYVPRDSLIRQLIGGFMVQTPYEFIRSFIDPDYTWYNGVPGTKTIAALCLGWGVCATSNSNTITLVNPQGQLIANAVGQQARVYASELATERASRCDHNTHGAIAVSDSFFPELDGVAVLASDFVGTIVTTSGAQKDDEVIKYCEEYGITLGMIPDAIGRGFFRH